MAKTRARFVWDLDAEEASLLKKILAAVRGGSAAAARWLRSRWPLFSEWAAANPGKTWEDFLHELVGAIEGAM
jgi:hypothetical protein